MVQPHPLDTIDTALQAHAEAIREQADASAMALHEAGASEAKAKTQAFFEELASEITRPHVGDFYRDFIKVLLRRATEKGLYK